MDVVSGFPPISTRPSCHITRIFMPSTFSVNTQTLFFRYSKLWHRELSLKQSLTVVLHVSFEDGLNLVVLLHLAFSVGLEGGYRVTVFIFVDSRHNS